VAKRGRGRPAGKTSKAAAKDTSAPPAKRGRPSKTAVTAKSESAAVRHFLNYSKIEQYASPKKRGRPSKSPKKATTASTSSPKKRGRPAGKAAAAAAKAKTTPKKAA
ncbi:hypothetical protein PMAYCL1PPCAC_06988, partial [Pristionchus mayeri]